MLTAMSHRNLAAAAAVGVLAALLTGEFLRSADGLESFSAMSDEALLEYTAEGRSDTAQLFLAVDEDQGGDVAETSSGARPCCSAVLSGVRERVTRENAVRGQGVVCLPLV